MRRSNETIIYIAGAISFIWQAGALAAPLAGKANGTGTQLQALGIARPDSAYRYLAEKGADLFRQGRFVEAEDYYRAALTNAEHDKVQGRRLAMLITNLATDLRQQQRYTEAEPLFERAVEIERKAGSKDEELMLYTARQYAGLLRETARDASADAVMDAARHSFAAVPTNSRTFLQEEYGTPLAENAASATVHDGADERREEIETKARLYDLQHNANQMAPQVNSGLQPGSAPQSSPPMPVLPSAPVHDVATELKMLADIERTYQDEGMQQSQMLPSSFSYMSGGPLYSSFGGIYSTRGGRFGGGGPARYGGPHHVGIGGAGGIGGGSSNHHH